MSCTWFLCNISCQEAPILYEGTPHRCFHHLTLIRIARSLLVSINTFLFIHKLEEKGRESCVVKDEILGLASFRFFSTSRNVYIYLFSINIYTRERAMLLAWRVLLVAAPEKGHAPLYRSVLRVQKLRRSVEVVVCRNELPEFEQLVTGDDFGQKPLKFLCLTK